VDFAYPEKKIYIEVDGSHHETRKQREDDLRRQNKLSRAGWLPFRYTRADVNAKRYIGEITELFGSG
jgi:very-short-patch-repair endonuclease